MLRRQLALAVLVAGCSRSHGVKIDTAAVNEAVPAELRAALRFEQRDLVVEVDGTKATYSIAVPEPFKVMPWIKPRSTSQLVVLGDLDGGKLTAGAICDGTCGLRDWKATVDELVFSPLLATASTTTIADNATIDPTTHVERRLLITKHDGTTAITQATWIAGGDRFWICNFELSGAWQDATRAFAKACESMRSDPAPKAISTAPPPPHFVDVPEHPELEIHLPAKTKPVSLGMSPGLGGFERADGLLFIVERADDGLVDVGTYKEQLQAQAAQPLSDRPIEGGWIVTYRIDATNDGVDRGVEVRRTIGDAVYKCGGIGRPAHEAEMIAACTSIKPKVR